MIFSENPKPEMAEFQELMRKTDLILNEDAVRREAYYASRNGVLLEDDVFAALEEQAKGTSFQGTIQKISGHHFPDIVAKKLYGVEVKSTKANHWTSTGSSILESTRVEGVERIYLTFGKLGKPVEFLSRPYEDCMSGIAVTHMPRYLIDMRLKKGETIFDQMNIPYDELRKMSNPIPCVSKYYKSKLKPGESLWWAGEEEHSAPPVIRFWCNLSLSEKRELIAKGFALFPEVVLGQYNHFSKWLVQEQSVINPNVRDSFSAGGRVIMKDSEGKGVETYKVFSTIEKHSDLIERILHETEAEEFTWYLAGEDDIITNWCETVAIYFNNSKKVHFAQAYSILKNIFHLA